MARGLRDARNISFERGARLTTIESDHQQARYIFVRPFPRHYGLISYRSLHSLLTLLRSRSSGIGMHQQLQGLNSTRLILKFEVSLCTLFNWTRERFFFWFRSHISTSYRLSCSQSISMASTIQRHYRLTFEARSGGSQRVGASIEMRGPSTQ